MLPVGFYFSSYFSLLSIERIFLNLKRNQVQNGGDVKAVLSLFQNVLILLSFWSNKIIDVVLYIKWSNKRRQNGYIWLYLPPYFVCQTLGYYFQQTKQPIQKKMKAIQSL